MTVSVLGYGLKWQLAGSIAVLGLGVGGLLPTLAPQYVRRYYQKYDLNNQPLEVTDNSLMLLDDVMETLKLPEVKRRKLDVFITYNGEPQYHGSMANKGHCLLGLPMQFNWTGEDDFKKNNQFLSMNFPWDYEAAGPVKSAMLLTDIEKKFVLARQLGYLDTQNVIVGVVQKLFCFGGAFAAGHVAAYQQGLFREKNNIPRVNLRIGVFYSVFSLAGYVFYSLMSDAYNCHLDKHADKYAATLGPEYAQAGLSYYNKMLAGNIALRGLSEKAEKLFTPYGNVKQGVIRTKTVPLVARRDYIARYMRTPSDEGISETAV